MRDALPLGVAEAGAAEEVAGAVRVARLGHRAALDTLAEICGGAAVNSVTPGILTASQATGTNRRWAMARLL